VPDISPVLSRFSGAGRAGGRSCHWVSMGNFPGIQKLPEACTRVIFSARASRIGSDQWDVLNSGNNVSTNWFFCLADLAYNDQSTRTLGTCLQALSLAHLTQIRALDLTIQPSKELEAAIHPASHQVTGLIQPSSCLERIPDKTFGVSTRDDCG